MNKIKKEKIMYGDQELEISCNMNVIGMVQDELDGLQDATVQDWLWAMVNDAREDQGLEPEDKETVVKTLFKGLRLVDYEQLRTTVLNMIVDSLNLVPAPEADPKNVKTAPEK